MKLCLQPLLLSGFICLIASHGVLAETCDNSNQPQAAVVGAQPMNVIDWLKAQVAVYLVLDRGSDGGFEPQKCVCVYKKSDGSKVACGLIDPQLSPPSPTSASVRFSIYPRCSINQSDAGSLIAFLDSNGIEETDPETQDKLPDLLYAKISCIKLPPENVSVAKVTQLKRDSISIQWSPGLYNESFLVSYAVGNRAPACGGSNVSGGTKFEAKNLKPATTYSFRICAMNKDGVSEGVTLKAKTKR